MRVHRCVKRKKAIEMGAILVNLLDQKQVIIQGGKGKKRDNFLIDYCPWCDKKLV